MKTVLHWSGLPILVLPQDFACDLPIRLSHYTLRRWLCSILLHWQNTLNRLQQRIWYSFLILFSKQIVLVLELKCFQLHGSERAHAAILVCFIPSKQSLFAWWWLQVPHKRCPMVWKSLWILLWIPPVKFSWDVSCITKLYKGVTDSQNLGWTENQQQLMNTN